MPLKLNRIYDKLYQIVLEFSVLPFSARGTAVLKAALDNKKGLAGIMTDLCKAKAGKLNFRKWSDKEICTVLLIVITGKRVGGSAAQQGLGMPGTTFIRDKHHSLLDILNSAPSHSPSHLFYDPFDPPTIASAFPNSIPANPLPSRKQRKAPEGLKRTKTLGEDGRPMSKNAAVAMVEPGKERRSVMEKGRSVRIQGKKGGNARNSRLAASLELMAVDGEGSLYSQNEVGVLVRQDGDSFLLLGVLDSLYTLQGKTRSLRRSVGGAKFSLPTPDAPSTLFDSILHPFLLFPPPFFPIYVQHQPQLQQDLLFTTPWVVTALEQKLVRCAPWRTFLLHMLRVVDGENGELEDGTPSRFFELDHLEVVASSIDPGQARLIESEGSAQYLSDDGEFAISFGKISMDSKAEIRVASPLQVHQSSSFPLPPLKTAVTLQHQLPPQSPKRTPNLLLPTR